jgi:23S rRNA pseudouridine1911/1915/1917 synthase
MAELDPDEVLLDETPPVVIPVPLRRGQEPIELVVRIKAEGMRLDHYLHLNFQDFSRSDLQEGVRAGTILVNGKTSKPSHKVRNNDKLLVKLPEPTHDLPVAENIPLEILYEDEFLALVNKPWNMVVHPAKGNWSGTLVNALQYHFKEALSNINGTHRPGIVHRLDKDTSGVILIGKEEQTHRELSMMFEQRKMFKEYIALCAGEFDRDSDYIEGAIKMHPHDRLRMIVSKDADAKEAVSYYEVVERFRGFTLVKIQPKTGRTHQIRVHLTHVGCPVLSDKVYGGRDLFRLSDVLGTQNAHTENDELLLERQALHAFRLRFKHPRLGNWLEVEAPLPPDMRRTLELFRQHRALR